MQHEQRYNKKFSRSADFQTIDKDVTKGAIRPFGEAMRERPLLQVIFFLGTAYRDALRHLFTLRFDGGSM